RSYVILLYILLGLVTGWYGGAQERWGGLPAFSVQRDWFKWCVLAVGSAIVLWIVVKVLFVMAGACAPAARSSATRCSPRWASTPSTSSACCPRSSSPGTWGRRISAPTAW